VNRTTIGRECLTAPATLRQRRIHARSAAVAGAALLLAGCQAPEPAAPIGGLTHHYVFDGYGAESTGVINRVEGGEPLALQRVRTKDAPIEPARTGDARERGRGTVRIDRACLAGPGTGDATDGFAAAMWVNLRKQGGLFGNSGSSNGTLIAVGNGYNDGWRVTLDTPRRTLSFSIGRPQPPHSVTLTTDPVPLGTWLHVAAAWDRREMRLYVDGLLAARRAFSEPYTRPAQDVMRVGFANAGVGSIEMDVDELRLFSRALSPSEALRLTAPDAAATAPFVLAFDDAVESLAATNTAAATDAASRCIAAARPLDPRLRAAAHRAAFDAARLRGDPAAAAAAIEPLIDLADLPDSQRAGAAEALLSLVRTAAGALPPRSMERAAALPAATPADRLNVLMILAQTDAAAGRGAEARRRTGEILAIPGLAQPHPAIAKLALARLAVESGDASDARVILTGIADDATTLETHRDDARRALAALRDPGAATRSRLSAPPTWPTPGTTLFVAPKGDDANPGTREKPFATLERARDAIRTLRAGGGLPAGGVAVEIAPGRFKVARTFELTAADSGAPGAPVVYRAGDPARPPEFDGGVRLTGFRPVTDAALRERLDPALRDRVVEVDLRACGITNLPTMTLGGYAAGGGFQTRPTPELFFNGAALPRARWPNGGFENVVDIHGATAKNEHGHRGCVEGVISYSGERPARWTTEPAGFLYGYWFHTWADSYEPIESIDPAARRIVLRKPWHRYGFRPGGAWYAVNLACEIDQPGEWSLDPAALGLRFLPPAPCDGAEVVLSLFDGPMLKAEGIAHVALVGLAWQYGAADAATISRATNVLVAGCTIRHFAGDALRLDGLSNTVRSCDISSMGRGGVSLSGGSRKTLNPGGNAVENCHIHDLSRLHPTYTPAVLLSGVGNRIAHCLVHDVASSAFRIAGDNHLVEMNEVFDVVVESDDQGGIDMWGNTTYRGNVFLHNYWHHIGNRAGSDATARVGRAAIRLDDAISGVVIHGNVFHRCGAGTGWFGAVQIHGGKDNQVDGNIVSHGPAAVSLSPWGEAKWRDFVKDALAHREIDAALHAARFPALQRLMEGINANHIGRNFLVACDRLTHRPPGPNQLVANLSVAADATPFVNAARGDFRLKPGARPPPCLGPTPIPFESIGLQHDAFRATVPTDLIQNSRTRVP
jgi:hypothetical protein